MTVTIGNGLTRQLTRRQEDLLAVWKGVALLRMPYMAPLIYALHPYNAPGLGTFAVDRDWRMYIDFDAVTDRGDLWCAESLLHEVGYLFNQHFARALAKGLTDADSRPVGSAQDQQAWAVAADLSINDDLTHAGCTTFAADGMVPATLKLPDHLSPEDYYDTLRSRTPPTSIPQARPGQAQGGQTGQQPGQCPSCSQPVPSSKPDRPAPQHGDGPVCGTCGQPARAPLGCGSGAGAAASAWELGPASSQSGVHPDQQRVALAATATLVQQAAAKSCGSIPGRWVEKAAAILAPSVVPWQQILGPTLRKGVNARAGADEQTWAKHNRRKRHVQFAGGQVIFPGTQTPLPVVVVVRDTSGSMSASDLAVVSSEVEGIARKAGVRDENLLVMDVDAHAYQVRRYSGAHELRDVHGRGGTDMRVGITAAANLTPRPGVIVVVTDGLTPWPAAPVNGVRTIACLVGEGAEAAKSQVPPFIRAVVARDRASCRV